MRPAALFTVLLPLAWACSEDAPPDPLARQLDLAFGAEAPDSIVRTLGSLQRDLFTRLTRDDASAAALMTLGFTVIDEAAPPAPSDYGPKLFAGLTRRFEPGTLSIREIEVRRGSQHSAWVVVFGTGRPSVTHWELKQDGWKARALQLNVSDRTLKRLRESVGGGVVYQ
ncbi:MAG TPA: hypothetical protein VK928_09265 [Longimicrobiales bacterium]|nr:hypothetical protein [Longimicrobiales bacterium]